MGFNLIILLLCLFFPYEHAYMKIPIDSSTRKNLRSITLLHVENPEESLKLAISIESAGFLKNIQEYGNARMARRAVGVLQKMPAYRILPQEVHYTEAIKACDSSDQFNLAVAVYSEMKSRNIQPTQVTFEALISVAEKTEHAQDALEFFEEMKRLKIPVNAHICNSCLIAFDRIGSYEEAFALIEEMKEKGIPRDVTSYTAVARVCEKVGAAEKALKVLELMEFERIEVSTMTINAVLWACVKGGECFEALNLFGRMDPMQIAKDEDSYKAAIWASEMGGDSEKAMNYLRKMKIEGLERDTMAFDGVLSALNRAGDWQNINEILSWMDREGVKKSPITHKLAIDAFDAARQDELVWNLYIETSREGYFSPWVPKSRVMDLRGFPLSMAKIALKSVLWSQFEGILNPFTLSIIVADVEPNGSDFDYRSTFDVSLFVRFLSSLFVVKLDKQKNFAGSTVCLSDQPDQMNAGVGQSALRSLQVDRVIEEGVEKLSISRESLVQWIESQDVLRNREL